MKYDVYILRCFHDELGFIKETYSTYAEAMEAVEAYIYTCSSLTLYGEYIDTYYGKLLISHCRQEG